MVLEVMGVIVVHSVACWVFMVKMGAEVILGAAIAVDFSTFVVYLVTEIVNYYQFKNVITSFNLTTCCGDWK